MSGFILQRVVGIIACVVMAFVAQLCVGCGNTKPVDVTAKKNTVGTKQVSTPPKPAEKPNPLYKAIGNGVSLVYFEKEGCPACDKMDPVIDQVLGKTGVNLIKLTPCRRDIIEFGIGHYPTFVLYAGGKEYRRWIGHVSEKKMVRSIGNAGKL